MNKKTKISLNSTLIETVVSKTRDIQEQMAPYADYGEVLAKMEKWERQWKRKRDRVAKLIFDGDWENFTTCQTHGCICYPSASNNPMRYCSDEGFYNRYHLDLYPAGATTYMSWGVDWKIQHYEEGEPGMCDNILHCILPIVEIGVLFIPFIGWGVALGISMTVGMVDALIYYNEGEKQTAGLVAFLTLLPGVPGVVKKFPFVKAWGKKGAEKIAGKIVAEESITMLEKYQLKALTSESAQKYIEKEVKQHINEIIAKDLIGETVEIGGKQITKEMVENAVKKGYLEITVDGITAQLSKEMIEKLGIYTQKQQITLIKFFKQASPFILAGAAYIKIYNEIAKTGIMGPKDLIRKLWGIEPRDVATIKANKLFMKLVDPDAVLPEYETNWEFITIMFNADGSSGDGELMVQAIKNGWNPYEDGKGLVPKKYRTQGYKEWVDTILSNEDLLNWFMSDGSEKDNELLLLWVFDNPDYEPGRPIDEKYHTETRKKEIQKEKEAAENPDRQRDEEGENVITLPDGTIVEELIRKILKEQTYNTDNKVLVVFGGWPANKYGKEWMMTKLPGVADMYDTIIKKDYYNKDLTDAMIEVKEGGFTTIDVIGFSQGGINAYRFANRIGKDFPLNMLGLIDPSIDSDWSLIGFPSNSILFYNNDNWSKKHDNTYTKYRKELANAMEGTVVQNPTIKHLDFPTKFFDTYMKQ